ncbi:MAG: hypothetical protein L6R38_001561 [Xanthoria sp. 2 TBL-2021]|nr:MAG: hypothetical protein L6R38_001561 [Xanthoria sp. 2 TBL-2021]
MGLPAAFQGTHQDFHNHLHLIPRESQDAAFNPPALSDYGPVHRWAEYLRPVLTALYAGGELHPRAFRAPYARASDPYEAALASNIAQILYSSPPDPTVSALDLYQRDTRLIRHKIYDQHVAEENELERRRLAMRNRRRGAE